MHQKELVRHVETTLARSLYNCDELYVRSSAACFHTHGLTLHVVLHIREPRLPFEIV